MIRRLLILALVVSAPISAFARAPVIQDGIPFFSSDGVATLPAVDWRQIKRLLPLKREYQPYVVERDSIASVTVELRSTFEQTRGYHVSFRKHEGEWVRSDGYFVKIKP